MPENVDEVRIVNCKITSNAISSLLSQIQGSNILKLGLVKVNITSNMFENVLDFIPRSRSLIDLDISWNQLTPMDLAKLFRVLSSNRQLQNLNISWNNI